MNEKKPKEKPKVIHLYFDPAEEVRASHLLYLDTQESIQWKGIPKWKFYVILLDEMGRAHGKDTCGSAGYKLKFVGFKGKIKE